MKKISFFCSYWPTNIGNAFIDLGSIQSVLAAAPSISIHTISGFPRLLFERRSRSHVDELLELFENIRKRSIGKQTSKTLVRINSKIPKLNRILETDNDRLQNLFDLGKAVKSDFAVFSGMVLYDYFIKQHKSTIMELKKKNVKIILNGVGGGYFGENEIFRIRKFLKEISPYAFISRDEKTFESYHDLAEHSHNGIACGFFIKDYYTPIKLDLPKFVVLNFDTMPEPKLNIINEMVIRTHHWSSYYKGFRKIPKRYFTKPNTLISDFPDDYLALYSNTSTLYSDRVHACVATLSFGRPCRLFIGEDDITRAALFEKVGANTIGSRITYPNIDMIDKEKEKQVRFLSDIFAHA